MKKQGGFTLIELVVVIVILGILAVTAAPRFLNIQDDAREATLKGLQGAMQGAMGITYGKAAIAGLEKSDTATITTDEGSVDLAFGYPTATQANWEKLVQGIGENDDFKFIKQIDGSNPAEITFGIENYITKCVKYTAAENATTPAKVEIEKTPANCTPD